MPGNTSKLRTLEHAAVAKTVAVAVADHAGLHKRAVPRHRDRVRIVVAQVEVACSTRMCVNAPDI